MLRLSVALPAENDHSTSQDMDISEILGLQTSSSPSAAPGQVNLADFATLFDWKKKSTDHLEDAKGRTKDLPTDDQLVNDSKHVLKNFDIKNIGKRHKLLIGEKYIIPLIQFLKNNSENLNNE